jgi:hypothetical protein
LSGTRYLWYVYWNEYFLNDAREVTVDLHLSTYDLAGIPDAIPVATIGFLFILAVSPYIGVSRFSWGGADRELPSGSKWNVFQRFVAPAVVVLGLLGFYPYWLNKAFLDLQAPKCRISASAIDEKTYRVRWFVDSEHPSEVWINGFAVENQASAEYSFDSRFAYQRHTLFAGNRFGDCGAEVRVTPQSLGAEFVEGLKCDLDSDKFFVGMGEQYEVFWEVVANPPFNVFINGSEVAPKGSGRFEFTGPNHDRFRLVANKSGITCEDNLMLLRDFGSTWK